MRTLFALVLLAALAQPAASQTLTKEETAQLVADQMAEINRVLPAAMFMSGSMSDSVVKEAVDAATRIILRLRDSLATNPYIRVSSFTVGLPAGVSVEFTFPPSEGN
jgi:hypothetical protein